MIEIKTIEVYGFEGAIRGMRNPYMSHEKSDSKWVAHCSCSCPYFSNMECDSNLVDKDSFCPTKYYGIGEADMKLAKKLIAGGSEHRKFMRMIHVQAEVKAPRYWWAEMDKYKWVEANSSSTMHLIGNRFLTIDDFSLDKGQDVDAHFFCRIIDDINAMIDGYNECKKNNDMLHMNYCLRAIKQLLPESYNQLRMIDTNYECLLNIYRQREAHRLSEWREFCDWILGLPYMKEFLGVS